MSNKIEQFAIKAAAATECIRAANLAEQRNMETEKAILQKVADGLSQFPQEDIVKYGQKAADLAADGHLLQKARTYACEQIEDFAQYVYKESKTDIFDEADTAKDLVSEEK